MSKLALKSIFLSIVLFACTPASSSEMEKSAYEIELNPIYVKTTPIQEGGNTQVLASKLSKEADSLVQKKSWLSPGARRLAVTGVMMGMAVATVAIDLYLMKNYLSAYQEGYKLSDDSSWWNGLACNQTIACPPNNNEKLCKVIPSRVITRRTKVYCPEVETVGFEKAVNLAENHKSESFVLGDTYYQFISNIVERGSNWDPHQINRVQQGEWQARDYPFYMGLANVGLYALLFGLYYGFAFC